MTSVLLAVSLYYKLPDLEEVKAEAAWRLREMCCQLCADWRPLYMASTLSASMHPDLIIVDYAAGTCPVRPYSPAESG